MSTDEPIPVKDENLGDAAVKLAGEKRQRDDADVSERLEVARTLAVENARKFYLAVIVAVVSALMGLITAVPAILAAYYGRDNSVQIEEVRVQTNSNLELQLRLLVRSAKRHAESGKPDDIEDYQLAVEALRQHQAQQVKAKKLPELEER